MPFWVSICIYAKSYFRTCQKQNHKSFLIIYSILSDALNSLNSKVCIEYTWFGLVVHHPEFHCQTFCGSRHQEHRQRALLIARLLYYTLCGKCNFWSEVVDNLGVIFLVKFSLLHTWLFTIVTLHDCWLCITGLQLVEYCLAWLGLVPYWVLCCLDYSLMLIPVFPYWLLPRVL